MKLKSAFSLMLCFFLLCSPVLAQTESEQMQAALTKAKTILTVPEDYTEFSYQSETDTDGTVYWYFHWSGDKKGNMEATLSEDGFLVSYYSWIYSESYDDSIADYTYQEAKEIALRFLEKVNPELFPNLREITPDGENRNSRTQRFLFGEYIGDVPVYQNTVSVTVDRYHGTVRNYVGAKKTKDVAEIGEILTKEAAKEAYIKEIGVQLEYRLYYDYKEKEYKVFPAYRLKDTSGKSVDAVTGQVVEPYFPDSYLFRVYGGGDMMEDAATKNESAGVQFTPAEMEALSNLEGVYEKEEALKIATSKVPALKKYSLSTASLQRDYRDETKIYWQFRLKKEEAGSAYVCLDAKSAQLISFSVPVDTYENNSFTREDAKKIAEVFLKKEASDVFSKTMYTEEEISYVPLKNDDATEDYYWLTYRRTENGIPVNGEGLSVRVDAKTKQVGAFERTYSDGITFSDISGCMSEEEIFETMGQKMKFALTYLPTKAEHIPAYTFLRADSRMFDPFTGKVLNYDGTEQKENILPDYTDIQGHWAEDMILTLLDNGYYFPEEAFRPDDTVTKKEFLTFVKMVGNEEDAQVNELIANIEEIEPSLADCSKPLTKEIAAGYLVYRMGYQKVAKLDEIFQYPFRDANSGAAQWKGDIALLTGFGIFHGDTDGNFYPEKELTRAEAASILYHFLKTQG